MAEDQKKALKTFEYKHHKHTESTDLFNLETSKNSISWNWPLFVFKDAHDRYSLGKSLEVYISSKSKQ
jgi:hypothetical protein